MMKILVVEDERLLADSLQTLLTGRGFSVDTANDGLTGLEYAKTDVYDLVILDVMMPGLDGYTVASRLRAEHHAVPILMLTAKSDLMDRVAGLNAGADYYLPKPFERSELIACLNVITRRKDAEPVDKLDFGDAELDREQAALRCRTTGRSVKLAAKEYQLMELFMRNPHQAIPKETILERDWGFENDAEYNNLSVYLTFLRRKIAFVGAKIEIRASRGLGYSLEEQA